MGCAFSGDDPDGDASVASKSKGSKRGKRAGGKAKNPDGAKKKGKKGKKGNRSSADTPDNASAVATDDRGSAAVAGIPKGNEDKPPRLVPEGGFSSVLTAGLGDDVGGGKGARAKGSPRLQGVPESHKSSGALDARVDSTDFNNQSSGKRSGTKSDSGQFGTSSSSDRTGRKLPFSRSGVGAGTSGGGAEKSGGAAGVGVGGGAAGDKAGGRAFLSSGKIRFVRCWVDTTDQTDLLDPQDVAGLHRREQARLRQQQCAGVATSEIAGPAAHGGGASETSSASGGETSGENPGVIVTAAVNPLLAPRLSLKGASVDTASPKVKRPSVVPGRAMSVVNPFGSGEAARAAATMFASALLTDEDLKPSGAHHADAASMVHAVGSVGDPGDYSSSRPASLCGHNA